MQDVIIQLLVYWKRIFSLKDVIIVCLLYKKTKDVIIWHVVVDFNFVIFVVEIGIMVIILVHLNQSIYDQDLLLLKKDNKEKY